MDLTSSLRPKKLKYSYIGTGISARQLLYVPLKIIQFEIVDSWIHPNKECLIMQVVYIDNGEVIKEMMWTEAYSLVKDIKNTENFLPHYTKLRKTKGYILFTQLNEKEKSPLYEL